MNIPESYWDESNTLSGGVESRHAGSTQPLAGIAAVAGGKTLSKSPLSRKEAGIAPGPLNNSVGLTIAHAGIPEAKAK